MGKRKNMGDYAFRKATEQKEKSEKASKNKERRQEELINKDTWKKRKRVPLKKGRYRILCGQLEGHVEGITERYILHNGERFPYEILGRGRIRLHYQGRGKDFFPEDPHFRDDFIHYMKTGE